MRFTGLDYDADPAAPEKLNAFIRQVEHILLRYDGSLGVHNPSFASAVIAATNAKVAALLGVDRVCYNSPETVRAVVGPGSYQALDASYPISERYWPAWLKDEVEHFKHYR